MALILLLIVSDVQGYTDIVTSVSVESGASTYTSGIHSKVVGYVNGSTSYACADSWTYNNSQVVCKELGYDKPLNVVSSQAVEESGLIRYSCFGNETALSNCVHETSICEGRKAALVLCSIPKLKNVTVSAVNQRSITVSITKDKHVQLPYSGYILCASFHNSKEVNVVAEQQSSPQLVSITNLQPNTTYQIQVAGIIGSSNIGPYTNSILVTTEEDNSDEVMITLTLSGQTNETCFGKSYNLTCDHPVLNGSYISSVLWKKDGRDFFPDGRPETSITLNATTTVLSIHVTETYFTVNHTYKCFLLRNDSGRFIEINSNPVAINPTRIPVPEDIQSRPTSHSISISWSFSNTTTCYQEYRFLFNVSWCNLPSVSRCFSHVTDQQSYTLRGLSPATNYSIEIVASALTSDIFNSSDTVIVDTSDEVLLSVSEHRICFGAAIMTKCKYSITDFQRIKRIEIHRKEDSLVLNSTDNITGEAVLSVQMTEELFPNGEAAILCAVLFENGHDTERSKINFISIQSLFPPVYSARTIKPSSVLLYWEHFDNCSIQCNIWYDISWKKNDSSSTYEEESIQEKFYTAEELVPGTVYTFRLRAYCDRGDISSEYSIITVSTTLSPTSSQPTPTVNKDNIILGVSVTAIVLLLIVVALILGISVAIWKFKYNNHNHDPNPMSSWPQ